MKTTVTHESDTRVKVVVAADHAELAAAEQVALKRLVKTVKVNGFRTGHVPLEIVKKHADLNALAQETLDAALNRAVAEAFLNNNLQVLARPEVEIKKYVPGKLALQNRTNGNRLLAFSSPSANSPVRCRSTSICIGVPKP